MNYRKHVIRRDLRFWYHDDAWSLRRNPEWRARKRWKREHRIKAAMQAGREPR